MAKDSAKKGSSYPKAQNPLILRFFRLVDAFAKADDERDFYFDKVEGFILFADLDKPQEDLDKLYSELSKNSERYLSIPKLSFYEQKKIMEGFVHEKVYDIDTKEKLLDIISSKSPRENFLEFLLDHLPEFEKWQQFYQERSRIRIIEWLRDYEQTFVFEEDLDLGKALVEKIKFNQFQEKAPKDVTTGRKAIDAKSKTYYSNEALNPRPKRGRPPKQTAKVELEPQLTDDMYSKVPSGIYTFLFTPDITSTSEVTFSSKFSTHEELIASYRSQERASSTIERLEALSQKLATMKSLSNQFQDDELPTSSAPTLASAPKQSVKQEAVEEPPVPAPKEKPRRLTTKAKKDEPKKKATPKKAASKTKAKSKKETAKKESNKPRRLIRKKPS